MKHDFKIGDSVKIKENASVGYLYNSPELEKIAKEQEEKIGIITEKHQHCEAFIVRVFSCDEEFFWATKDLELIDLNRIQMLELEQIL